LDDEGFNGKPGNGRSASWLEILQRLVFGRRRILSEQELQEIIQESEEGGIINEEEGEMLHSIFEFGETIVREVMVPRTDMVCCPTTASLEEVLEAIISSGHSRIPIYEGTTDRIVGVVYAKDLLKFWGRPAAEIQTTQVMRTPILSRRPKTSRNFFRNFVPSGYTWLLPLTSMAELPA
jgi:magnesium and cobalt transporter